MIVAYIGNFLPDHSTESHVRTAWLARGDTVIRIQENNPKDWEKLLERMTEIDLVMWTTTASYAQAVGSRIQAQMLASAKKAGVPTVAFHLDRWHGLDREDSLYTLPFFRCDIVITANGGPDWDSIGINHVWMPPAVSLPETELGEVLPNYISNVAFVGTWRGYHREWEHRAQLIEWLKNSFPRDVRFWPRPGQPSIRGADLRNLYASTKVVVGDSCLSGDATHYWSDRIPETVGRGGFLIHPYVKGLEEHYTIGEHLVTWNVGDWDVLHREITRGLQDQPWARHIALAGRDHVRKHHTYEVRVEQIAKLL